MDYIKYTLLTKRDAVDLIGAELDAVGIEGIEIEDGLPASPEETAGMFIDILPDASFLTNDLSEGEARVHFYLPKEEDHKEILEKVKEALSSLSAFVDLGDGSLSREDSPEGDWLHKWKRFFKPFMVEDILIKPTWEEVEEGASYKTLIEIDPGTAFGTGSHETTRLCIQALRKWIPLFLEEKRKICLLDVGTGSGILGIVALKLGASHVFATDLDSGVEPTLLQNLAANEIQKENFEFAVGDILEDEPVRSAAVKEYDIITANILAPVLIRLQKGLDSFLRPGGVLILSGIIDEKEEAVKSALEDNPDFDIIESVRLGEWVSITAKKR